jgi:soluble lytic murein transglycosylase
LTRVNRVPIIEVRMSTERFPGEPTTLQKVSAGEMPLPLTPAALTVALLAALFAIALGLPAPAGAQTQSSRHAKKHTQAAQPAAADNKADNKSEDELEMLARGLGGPNGESSYAKLSLYQGRNAGTERGRWAALALGHYNYEYARYDAARTWFAAAKADALLGDYALYWQAQSLKAQKQDDKAIDSLDDLRGRFPASVLTDRTLAALAQITLEINAPERALASLSAVQSIETKPALLVLRGEAREKTGALEGAAQDYIAIRYRYPLSKEAQESGPMLAKLRERLAESFPEVPLQMRLARADALYQAHRWSEAREEYQRLEPEATGETAELARLRRARASVAMGGSLDELQGMHLATPSVDAMRLYELADAWRTKKRSTEMQVAVEESVSRAPASEAAERALFLAGNYYWAESNRAEAGNYYGRIVVGFPNARDTMAAAATWRVAWTAYLNREPGGEVAIQKYIKAFPDSSNIDDAVYFLGRAAERAANVPRARGCYQELRARFAETYFGRLGAERLKAIGSGPEEPPEVLAAIAPAPRAPVFEEADPPAESLRVKKSRGLEEIGLDEQAEEELRAEYAATGEPVLLLEIAEAAVRAGAYGKAIVVMRELFPQLESHPFSQLPRRAWRTSYPLPYAGDVRAAAAQAGVDPMLVAGLVRQESAFSPGAVSRAKAYGLMQLLPSTARKLAKQERLGYSQSRLTEPAYNLRLGSVYLAGLIARQGGREAALASYNAGEDRVATWRASANFSEPAEFVESIPFTETREYVQIVIRNSAIYQRLYGEGK